MHRGVAVRRLFDELGPVRIIRRKRAEFDGTHTGSANTEQASFYRFDIIDSKILKSPANNSSNLFWYWLGIFAFNWETLDMLKKLVLGALLVGGASTALVGTSGFSYVRTGFSSIRDGIKDQIPIELEIRRARDMISNLKPEITGNLQLIAREEVEVSRLVKEVERKQEQLEKAKRDMLRLKKDVGDCSESNSDEKLVYAGRKYSLSQVREDLNMRFKQYQTQEATADKLSKILVAREKNLDASRRKLDEMLAAKRQLEIEVENLQARLTMVQVAETAGSFTLNDSSLSQTRQLLDDIATRIDVAEKVSDSEGVLQGAIPLDEAAPSDIVDQISSYFEVDDLSVESVATK
jgi:hypothetical protein